MKPGDPRMTELQQARAARAEASRRAVHAAAAARDPRRPETITAWERAAAEFRAAVNAAYPPGFVGIWSGLRQGDIAAVEMAVTFLETDPWFFRSGYVKERLIRHLNRRPLTVAVSERLRQVVLAVVDGRDRREFRCYCRLARKVDSPGLRQALRQREHVADPGVRRRAAGMRAAVEDRAGTAEAAAAELARWRARRPWL